MAAGQPPRAGWAADGLLLLCLTVLLRVPTIAFPEIDWDETAFVLVAREILHNAWPYTAVFEHKPIGLYLHVAAALVVIGDTPIALRLLGILTAATTALLILVIVRRQLRLSRAWGLLLGASYLVGSVGFGGQAVFSEHFVNLYALLAALLVAAPRSKVLLAGLAAGVAINVNYLAAPLLAGLAAGHLLGLKSVRRLNIRTATGFLASFLGGALISTAFLLLPICLFSSAGDYFGPQLRFLFGYSAPTSLGSRLTNFAMQAAVLLPLAATAAALIYLLGRAKDQERRQKYHPLLFAGMSAGSVVAAFSSGYTFPHYFLLLLPPGLLLVASLAAGSRDRSARTISAAVLMATALMIGMPGLALAALGSRNLVIAATSGELADPTDRLARIGSQYVDRDSTVYALCSPLVLYQLLHARTATKYPFYMHSLNPRYAAALGINIDAEVAGIFAQRPALLIVGDFHNCSEIPRSSWWKVQHALKGNGYQLAARYEGYSFFTPRS